MPDEPELHLGRWLATARAWSTRVNGAFQRAVIRVLDPPDDSPPPPPPPPGKITFYQHLDRLAVPAQGDVFEFQVYVTLAWTSRGLRPVELKERAWDFQAQPRQEIARMAAGLARRHAPHRSRELEQALGRRLAEMSWHFARSDVVLHCRPEVRVRLDERLRAHLEPIWQKMATLEAEHEVNRRRNELVADLTRRWLGILDEFQGNPVTPAAARLTERELADVLVRMAEGQPEVAEQIRALLDAVARAGAGGGPATGDRHRDPAGERRGHGQPDGSGCRHRGGSRDDMRATVDDLYTETLREQLIADSRRWLSTRTAPRRQRTTQPGSGAGAAESG